MLFFYNISDYLLYLANISVICLIYGLKVHPYVTVLRYKYSIFLTKNQVYRVYFYHKTPSTKVEGAGVGGIEGESMQKLQDPVPNHEDHSLGQGQFLTRKRSRLRDESREGYASESALQPRPHSCSAVPAARHCGAFSPSSPPSACLR